MLFPHRYVASFQIHGLTPKDYSSKQILDLERLFADRLLFQNLDHPNPSDPYYLDAKYVPQSLSLHFQLDAPLGLKEMALLLQTWGRIIATLPADSITMLQIPQTIDEKINQEIRDLSYFMKNPTKKKELEAELRKLLEKLRAAPDVVSSSKLKSIVWFENERASSHLSQSIDQARHLLSSEDLLHWKTPDLSQYESLKKETDFVAEKISTFKGDVLQGYNQIASESLDCDISQPCWSLYGKWKHLLAYSLTPDLLSLIHHKAAQSSKVWADLIGMKPELGQELEERLMKETIYKLRQLNDSGNILMFVNEMTGRCFAAKKAKDPMSAAIPLPYSIQLPLKDVYVMRKGKWEESASELEAMERVAQEDFAVSFWESRRGGKKI